MKIKLFTIRYFYYVFPFLESVNICLKENVTLSEVETECNSGPGIFKPSSALVFLALFLQGIGSTVFHTLALPYLDDNTKAKHAPIVLGKLLFLVYLNHLVPLFS